MTKRKKFQNRVRSRMATTGENYTQAAETETQTEAEPQAPVRSTVVPLSTIEHFIQQLLKSPHDYSVDLRIKEFHRAILGDSPGVEALLSHIKNILSPKEVSWATGKASIRPPGPDAEKDIRELLTQYAAKNPISDGVIFRSFKNPGQDPLWVGGDWSKEEYLAEPDTSDDGFTFDPVGGTYLVVDLSPEEQHMWDLAWMDPDVQRYQEYQEKNNRPKVWPNTVMEKAASITPKDVAVSLSVLDVATSIRVLDQKIQQLRKKLEDAGIDPDA